MSPIPVSTHLPFLRAWNEFAPACTQPSQVHAMLARNVNTWEFTEEEKARIRVELFLRDIDRLANPTGKKEKRHDIY
jgi:hypothetical protein